MKTFREYFIAEAVKEDQTPKKINKIKSVINTAFGWDMVLLTPSQKSFFERAMVSGNFIDTLTIDLTHKNISKEFVQLMLRIAK